MDRDTERLHEAREELDRTQQRLEAVRLPQEEGDGADPQGVVTVRLSPDGSVRSLVVAHGWRDRVAPRDLAEAISAAYVTAGGARLEGWAAGLDEAFEMPAPTTRPLPMTVADVRAAIPDSESLTEDEVMSRISILWAEIEAELDATTGDLEQRAAATHRVTNPEGTVRVEVSAAGALLDLELRESWLERAHPANIGRTVLVTIERAQLEAVTAFAGFRADIATGTDRLKGLADPTELTRRVGLDR